MAREHSAPIAAVRARPRRRGARAGCRPRKKQREEGRNSARNEIAIRASGDRDGGMEEPSKENNKREISAGFFFGGGFEKNRHRQKRQEVSRGRRRGRARVHTRQGFAALGPAVAGHQGRPMRVTVCVCVRARSRGVYACCARVVGLWVRGREVNGGGWGVTPFPWRATRCRHRRGVCVRAAAAESRAWAGDPRRCPEVRQRRRRPA